MKRMLPVLLVLVIALLPGAPARAAQAGAPAMSQERVLALIQAHFPLPEAPGAVEVQPPDPRGGPPFWQVSWKMENASVRGSTQWIGTVDGATGRILDYDITWPELRAVRTGPLVDSAPDIRESDETLGRQRALELIEALRPGQSQSLLPMPADTYRFHATLTWDVIVFTFAEAHESIPNAERMISVALERGTLRYLGVHDTLDAPVTYQGAPALSSEQALERFAARSQPKLTWQLITSQLKPLGTGMLPLYSFDPLPVLDAATGAFFSGLAAPRPGTASEAGLTAVPGCPAVPPGAAVTRDEAVALAHKVLGLTPRSGRYSVDSYYVPNWLIVMVPDASWQPAYQVILDQTTGRLHRIQRPAGKGESVPADPAEAKRQAAEAAYQVIREQFGYTCAELRWADTDVSISGSVMRFNFHRYVQSLPVPGDGVTVTIDLPAMAWSEVSVNWIERTFPDASSLVPLEEARRSYLAQRSPLLVWQRQPGALGEMPRVPGSGPAATVRPYYRLPGLYYIVNGLTGALVDSLGRTPAAAAQAEARLIGDRSETELRRLLTDRALEAVDVAPAEPVRRLAALTILLQYRPLPGYAQALPSLAYPFTDVAEQSDAGLTLKQGLRAGLFRLAGAPVAFQPEAPLSRAEFALWTARLIGLGPLTRSNLAMTPAPSALGLTPEQQKAVAMLGALDLLPAGDAAAPLTQSDLAYTVVRLIRYFQAPA